MRIAFAYDVPYPWHVGGIESMNYNEAVELAKMNEVHFFTTLWEGMKGPDFVFNGIRYHTAHKTSQAKIYRHGRRSIREAVSYSVSLRRIFNYDFDVVITNAFPIMHLPLVKHYCRQRGAKLILEVAEVWDRKYWRSYLGPVLGDMAYAYSKSAISNADFYITISSTTTEKLVKMGIDRSKIMIFAPTLDNEAIDRINSESIKRSKSILFAGRMIKEKRLDLWLKMFKAAYRKDSALRGHLIGNGPERADIARRIRELGLHGKVTISDFYSSNLDLYRKIREASVVLHMSEREGLGIIAIEAAALETPVLLPEYTPIPKEVKDMCVVSEENNIPKRLVEIANSSNKATFIRNRKNINTYSKSQVNNFYSRLFSKLGIK